MRALDSWKEGLSEKLTPVVGWVNLQAMAQVLNLVPSMRHHLRDRHPSGATFEFEAGIQFMTRDHGNAVHVRFGRGRMMVGFGRLDNPDMTVRFRLPEHMRTFFSSPSEVFNLMLANDVDFDGNLSYLAKFGHMSTAVKMLGRKRQRRDGAEARRGPARWQDLAAPPPGEPCGERPEGELSHLEDPYLAGYCLDDFPRVKRLLWAFRVTDPEICSERGRLVTEFALSQRGRNGVSPALRQARALAYILRNKRAVIHDDDLLAGTTTARRIGVVLYPEGHGTTIWPELLTVETRALNPYRISDRDIEILDRWVFPFWMEGNVREWTRREFESPEELRLEERWVLYFLWKHTALSHTIADMPRVLSEGLAAIRDRAEQKARRARRPSRREFYQAMAEAVSGVIDYASRMAARARQLASEISGDDEEFGARRRELLEMARVCDKVPAGPAESLHEAIQAIWLVFLAMHQESTNAGLSLGRLDVWLQPYLERDMAGVSDPAERRRIVERAIELTCVLMLKMTDHLPLVPDVGNRLFGGSSSNPVITVGGQTADGQTAVCDMTWIFLKATEMLRLRDPNVNARFAPGINSEAYLRRLCEVNLLTRATPSLHNDAAVVPAMVEQGFSLAHARDWSATGCVEPTSCGRHFGHTNCMMFNLVAPMEMALNQGCHPVLREQVGPATADPRTFASYEEFLEAYQRQLAWLIERAVEGNNKLGKAHQVVRPTPLLSALFDGPMESGRDLTEGGARYNTSGVALIGLSDVIDSLAVIKRLVFETGQVDFDRLLSALEANFEGHGDLLARIRSQVPKFGREDPLTERIASDLIDFLYRCFQSKQNYRGGKYLPGYWSMSNHVAFGKLSGALPSGRLRGKAFTPGLTPAPGCGADLTEQIHTVAGLPGLKMPNNIAFNVKVVPGAKDSHQQVLDRISAYVGAYFDLGGMQIQFNVVSTETLKHAMRHPGQYRDLLVRISGYNAYFVELNRDMQIELVERMEHSLGAGNR